MQWDRCILIHGWGRCIKTHLTQPSGFVLLFSFHTVPSVGKLSEKFLVILVPPEHQSELGSVKSCSQLLLLHPSPVSSAVTPSYRRKTSQRLCACLCCSLCNRMYLHSFDETFYAKFVCCSNTFLMSCCRGIGSSVRGGVMATDYSLATLEPTPQLGVFSSWLLCRFALLCLYECLCVCLCVCVLIKICQRKVESTFRLFATSLFLSLQWWRVTELWYLNLSRDSLILQSLTLHSSLLWHPLVNYQDLHHSWCRQLSFDVCMWKEFSQ